MEVLIFDDDALSAELIAQIVIEAGFPVDKYPDGSRALQEIKRRRPALVILDVMMPGADGLSICRALKADPQTASIKVVIATAKSYPEDKENALRSGADEFISKPYRIQELRGILAKHLGPAPAKPGAAQARPPAFRARVWPLCLTLEFDERRVILDAGSGLAQACADPKTRGAGELWLLLSHYHADHVSGLEALKGLPAGIALKVAGPADPATQLPQLLASRLGGAGPKPQAFSVAETRFQLWPDVQVSSLFTRHPGMTLAYRFHHKDRGFVYCPDNELETDEEVETDFTEKFSRFIRGADVLLHDAKFMNEDYAARAGAGHGCPRQAVGLASKQGVRKLALFHMDPGYDRARLEASLIQVKDGLKAQFSSLSVDLALPGTILEI